MPDSGPNPFSQNLRIRADLHAHTLHSHAQASTEAMYRSALAKGLAVFGFSEHSPRPAGYAYPADYQDKLRSGFDAYVAEVKEMARRGASEGMKVLLGLEVDYLPGQEAFARDLCRAYDFDYIIGGLHFQGTWGFDFSAGDWAPLPLDERFAVYERYYADLASLCRSGLFHIAAHPDLIKIFTVDSFNAWLETPDAPFRIADALQSMKDNNVAMEISSAGLRKPCKEIYPGPKIMALARDFGLAISFGSDAHCTNTPAYAFEELADYAARYGFTHSRVVEKGQPTSLPFA